MNPCPVEEDSLRETFEDELQKLQLANIKLKSENKVYKNKIKYYQERLNDLQSEIKLLANKKCKCQSEFKAEETRNDSLQQQNNAMVNCKYRLI